MERKTCGWAVDVKNGHHFDTILRNLSIVILTPHIGGSTEEVQRNVAVEVASKLVHYLHNGPTTTSTNSPEIEMLLSLQFDTNSTYIIMFLVCSVKFTLFDWILE